MKVILDTRVFYFNADTDFLAYYKNMQISVDDDLKVKDVLAAIEEQDPLFTYRKTGTLLCVNGVSVKGTLPLKEALALFGSTWTIDPITTYRAVKDLTINDDDFIAKHDILASFADEEDFKFYKTLTRYYYASGTLKLNQEYMGDSMFLYADHLIQKYPEKKEAILKAIDTVNGIWSYEKECSIYPYEALDETINALKEALGGIQLPKGYTPESMDYYDKAESVLCSHFGVEKDPDCALETIIDNIGIEKVKEALKHPFSEFHVAFYCGSFACESVSEVREAAKALLEAVGANVVAFESDYQAEGFDIVSYDKVTAYKKAGNILLDAFDRGAEILVVDSKETHFMLDQSVKMCEKVTGRDIKIPVLNISQFVALAIGILDVEKLGINGHKIKPEFI